jgi:N6-adenosine-specific RNA methylase IME4
MKKAKAAKAKKAAKGKIAKPTLARAINDATRKKMAKAAAPAPSRKQAKAERALLVRCPSCHAKVGAPCFDRQGRQVPTPHRLRVMAAPAAKAATEKQRLGKAAPASPAIERPRHGKNVPTIAIDKIIIGKRHRKAYVKIDELAQSINERGGLIQPIALLPDFTLFAGGRRIKAWQQSNFAAFPIPYHVLDVDSILAGEWDENAQREPFKPEEAVSLKNELEQEYARRQRERDATTKAAPGRKASGEDAGRIKDKIAKFVGKDRKTLEKAEAVVKAAARDPKNRDLVDQMNASGKVTPAFKKLQVREARQAIEKQPPALPMNAEQCGTWVIDFPWAGEPDAEQAKLDAADRAFRPYPEMSIKTACAFAREQIAPRLPEKVTVWLWVTNFHLVRGYHLHVIEALGFKPDNASTMLTWDKVIPGQGKILRGQSEHCIPLTRGGPVIDVFGENPPTTMITEARRENSRKPDAFYRLVERVTPAKRYASIFSQGGEGKDWDSHGDQVGKFAPAIAREAEAELLADVGERSIKTAATPADGFALDDLTDWKLLGAIDSGIGVVGPRVGYLHKVGLIEQSAFKGAIDLAASWALTQAGVARLAMLDDKFRAQDLRGDTAAPIEPWRLQLAALYRVALADGKGKVDLSDIDPQLYDGLIAGKPKVLTGGGRARFAQLNELSRLDQLDAVANGRGAELQDTVRELLKSLGYVAATSAKRLTKHGDRNRLRLRDFREEFVVEHPELFGDVIVPKAAAVGKSTQVQIDLEEAIAAKAETPIEAPIADGGDVAAAMQAAAEQLVETAAAEPRFREMTIGEHTSPAGHFSATGIEGDLHVATCECGFTVKHPSHDFGLLEQEIVDHWLAVPRAAETPIAPAAETAVEQLVDAPVVLFDVVAEREALAAIDAGQVPPTGTPLILARRGLAHAGKETLTLTNLGRERLATLQARRTDAEQLAGDDPDDLEIPAFLRRGPNNEVAA